MTYILGLPLTAVQKGDGEGKMPQLVDTFCIGGGRGSENSIFGGSWLTCEAWISHFAPLADYFTPFTGSLADHFAMDGIADYSIISGLQTTYIQRSTTALNHPICCICQCKFLNNRISRRKCIRLLLSLPPFHSTHTKLRPVHSLSAHEAMLMHSQARWLLDRETEPKLHSLIPHNHRWCHDKIILGLSCRPIAQTVIIVERWGVWLYLRRCRFLSAVWKFRWTRKERRKRNKF